MADYVDVTWTGGDILTEAKLDNMVANDRSENAHESGIKLLNTTGKIQLRNASGVLDAQIYEDSNNVLQFVQGAGGFAGLDIALATQIRGNISAGANKAQFPFAPRAFTIDETIIQVAADGTQAGAQMTFDVNKNGSTIWSTQANRLKLSAATARGVATTFDTTAVSKYDNFSLDVDVTDTAVKNLIAVIIGQ
jgi:hypothetical protein